MSAAKRAGHQAVSFLHFSPPTSTELIMEWGTVKNICLFIWSLKSVFLLPMDIYTDVMLAVTDFNNRNTLWSALTVIFMTPSLLFPYHYYQIIKYVVLEFKSLFGHQQSKPKKAEVNDVTALLHTWKTFLNLSCKSTFYGKLLPNAFHWQQTGTLTK